MSDFTWEWLAGYFSIHHIHMSLILVFTGCFFLPVSPLFSYQKENHCSNNKLPFYMQNFVEHRLWLAASRVAQLAASLHPGCKEMEREWGNEEEFTLYIYSLSLYFLPLFAFPISIKICHILSQTLLLRMSQKTYYMRYEKIWVEFAARKLHKLCQPGWKPFSFLVLIEKAASLCT